MSMALARVGEIFRAYDATVVQIPHNISDYRHDEVVTLFTAWR